MGFVENYAAQLPRGSPIERHYRETGRTNFDPFARITKAWTPHKNNSKHWQVWTPERQAEEFKTFRREGPMFPTLITDAFIQSYETKVHEIFDRRSNWNRG